jgi:hypothetical protein
MILAHDFFSKFFFVIHVYILIFYMCMKSLRKTDICVPFVKEWKHVQKIMKCLMKKNSTGFCLFCTRHKKYRFFVKRLCEHIKHCDVWATYLSYFLHFKVRLKFISITQEHMLLVTKASCLLSVCLSVFDLQSVSSM